MSVAFNLVWVNPPPTSARNVNVAYGSKNTIVVGSDREAVILFPSLMTPFVYHEKNKEPWIELLLASNATITAAHVNRQLKVYEGLNADKRFHEPWLFAAVGNNITVEDASKDDGILRTHQAFEGVLHELFEERLSNAGFTKFFRVRLHHRALESASKAAAALRPEEEKENLAWRAERHDGLIKDMLERRNVMAGYKTLPEKGRFAFKVDRHGPQPWIDRTEPIQAYHPVYYFQASEPEYLNFGHLTDFHLNYRLEILKHTPARVIEGVSKSVGDLLQSTNRSFTHLLNQIASNRAAHALVIGGDLIDHQLNAFTTTSPADMEQVWDAVDLKKVKQRYAPCVDIVGFYSLLMHFCRSSSKPVFGIAGNHDAYEDPFGISPRMLGTRANAGIPADLNLTLYEAVLAFGPSFADFTFHMSPPSSFTAAWMEWFYTVFTPFGEASIQLPKQRVVCLGWGNDEDMMQGGQGDGLAGGHLPRADESINEVQLKLLRNAVKGHQTHRVIVISHFTVASFEERVPMRTGAAATVGNLRTDGDEDKYNMGTFEKNHDEFLKILKDRTITCILTGHSHRRGLYFLGAGKINVSAGSASFPVTIHDPDGFDVRRQPDAERMPAIVVSDSGGPYPRYNWNGEFNGWGSDRPGASIVTFDTLGALDAVKVLRAGSTLPRLAVALDYLDIERTMVWAKPLQTKSFLPGDEAKAARARFAGGFYELLVPLHAEALRMRLQVQKIEFFTARVKEPALSLSVGAKPSVRLNQAQSQALYDWKRRGQASDMFLALTFHWTGDPDAKNEYDMADPWIFEVSPRFVPDTSSGGYAVDPMGGAAVDFDYVPGYYMFERPLRFSGSMCYSDLPDFERRKKQNKKS